MSYKGNKNLESAPFSDLIDFKKKVRSKPPLLRRNKIVIETKTKFSKSGNKYTETIAITMGVRPRFKYIEDDIGDSYWYYPEISRQVIATAKVDQGSHPEYFEKRNQHKNKKGNK